MNGEPGAPQRLSETSGAAGDCLRSALARQELTDLPPFRALRERRQRQVQRQLALASALLGVVAVLGLRVLHHDEEAPSVRAELTSVPESAILPVEPAPPSALPEPPAPRSVKSSAVRAAVAPSVARVDRAKLARQATGQASPANAVAPATPSGGARACAELARSGQATDALGCYEALSNGSGMTAELALFEQARLEGKALRHPERALQILDVYRRRFPQGSLRAEVMLARIDWLLALGERARARGSVDEALASGLLRERTAELERLRATLAAPDSQPVPR